MSPLISPVYGFGASERRRGHDGPRMTSLRVPGALLERLLPFARSRCCSASELAAGLLEAVLEGGLVDAVLDDKGGDAPPGRPK